MSLFRLIPLIFFIALSAWADCRYMLRAATEADARRIASQYGLAIEHRLGEGEDVSLKVTAVGTLSGGTITAIRSEPTVRWFEPDSQRTDVESDRSSNAKYVIDQLPALTAGSSEVEYFNSSVRAGYVQQAAAAIVRLSEAQRTYGTGANIIAVIDTGVDVTHPALRGVLLPGYDFTRNRPDTTSELNDLAPSTAALLESSRTLSQSGKVNPIALNQSTVAILDQSTVAILDGVSLPQAFGHGTMAAGLVHLIAPTARILPLKAFRSDGTANISDIARAVRYAADNGAKVISMSFSSKSNSTELQNAIEYAQSKGVICVASAGNAGKQFTVYPAAYRDVVGVGSTNAADLRSGFSNYGDGVTTAAPGEALVTTYPGNNYAGVWGTSFSSALVAGAVALCAQANPNLSFKFFEEALEGGPRISQNMGDARLDVERVLWYCTNQR